MFNGVLAPWQTAQYYLYKTNYICTIIRPRPQAWMDLRNSTSGCTADFQKIVESYYNVMEHDAFIQLNALVIALPVSHFRYSSFYTPLT